MRPRPIWKRPSPGYTVVAIWATNVPGQEPANVNGGGGRQKELAPFHSITAKPAEESTTAKTIFDDGSKSGW